MLVELICSFYDIIQVILLYATICKIFYERSVLCSAKADISADIWHFSNIVIGR